MHEKALKKLTIGKLCDGIMCKVIREASPEDAPFIVDMIRAGANEEVYHTNECSLSVEEFQKYAFESPAKGYLLMVCQ
jgi:hypothetical protein